MRLVIGRNSVCAAVAVAAFVLAGCQGNLGGGGAPGLPQPPGQYAPTPSAPYVAPYTRMRSVEGAVFLASDMTTIPLPAIGGFAISLLVAPEPSATPSPSAAAKAALKAAAGAKGASPGPSASGASPAAGASLTPDPSPSPTASPLPSPAPSAAPSAGSSMSPGPLGSAHRPNPQPSGPKIETKTTIYPDDAPVAPSPEATGNVQTYFHRTAIVRGFLMPATDITLASLGAVRFTIPKEEQTPNRSFVVAIYDNPKKHKTEFLAWSGDTTLANGVVSASGASDSIKLKKGVGYSVVLYGDELPATPPPTPTTTLVPAGQNPYASPMPAAPGAYPPGYPPQPGAPQPTYPPGYPTPTPIVIGPH